MHRHRCTLRHDAERVLQPAELRCGKKIKRLLKVLVTLSNHVVTLMAIETEGKCSAWPFQQPQAC